MIEITTWGDTLLQKIRDKKLPVTMFLINGFQLHGTIGNFDREVIFFNSNGRQQIVFRHAVSTIDLKAPIDIE